MGMGLLCFWTFDFVCRRDYSIPYETCPTDQL